MSITRRELLTRSGPGALGLAGQAASSRFAFGARGPQRLNVLLITVDDMNYNTPGCMRWNYLPGLTPNIDRLASEGMLFMQAHVAAAKQLGVHYQRLRRC